MNENVHKLLEGTIAEMMLKLDPTIYRKHIWYTKQGNPMLYVQLKKHYMGNYKQHYCSGNYYQICYRTQDTNSNTTHMPDP